MPGGNEVFPGKIVIGLDGLFAQVTAGHDERVHTAGFCRGKQQMLKRRIGEHDAELGQVVRDRWREGEDVGGTAVALASSALAQQHNGADTAGEKLALSVVDMAQAPASARLRTMTASGLLLRRLRRRNSATACSLAASQARWNPPRPLMATMPPLASSSTQRSMIASLASHVVPTAVSRTNSRTHRRSQPRAT